MKRHKETSCKLSNALDGVTGNKACVIGYSVYVSNVEADLENRSNM